MKKNELKIFSFGLFLLIFEFNHSMNNQQNIELIKPLVTNSENFNDSLNVKKEVINIEELNKIDLDLFLEYCLANNGLGIYKKYKNLFNVKNYPEFNDRLQKVLNANALYKDNLNLNLNFKEFVSKMVYDDLEGTKINLLIFKKFKESIFEVIESILKYKLGEDYDEDLFSKIIFIKRNPNGKFNSWNISDKKYLNLNDFIKDIEFYNKDKNINKIINSLCESNCSTEKIQSKLEDDYSYNYNNAFLNFQEDIKKEKLEIKQLKNILKNINLSKSKNNCCKNSIDSFEKIESRYLSCFNLIRNKNIDQKRNFVLGLIE